MDLVSSENGPKKRSRSKMRSEAEHQDLESPPIPTETVDDRDDEKGDGWNIAMLLFLYLLQGIPLGLSSAIPIILTNRKVDYKDQAEFSFVGWPFSMKLLWAPIVDAVFSARFGRRKSWLIPVQYLIGIFMLFISMNVTDWLGDESGKQAPRIQLLTIMFFICNFLAATQDIAVDGWALTMLHRKNLGHASTCNSVGQTAGFFLGYVLFIALDSADLYNKIFGANEKTGLVSFSTFMFFWGVTYIISTTLVAIFKKDTSLSIVENEKELDMNVKESYLLLWEILKLKPVQKIAVILLTAKIGFAAIDAVSPLKLVENGVPKDRLALMAIPLVPLQIILPFLVSKYVVGPRPMDCFLSVIPFRLLIGLMVAVLVYVTPNFIVNHELPYYYYGMLLLVYGLHQMSTYCMFVASMAFFAKISDPRSGGTYMTLLNTLSNLGGTWPSTVILFFVDILTWKKCTEVCEPNITPCVLRKHCTKIMDGFFVEVIICTLIGLLWLKWGKSKVQKLQNLSESAWLVNNRWFSRGAVKMGNMNELEEEYVEIETTEMGVGDNSGLKIGMSWARTQSTKSATNENFPAKTTPIYQLINDDITYENN